MTTPDQNEISTLLPFYVNGSLDADEAAIVRKAIEEDASLAREERDLRLLRDRIQSQTNEQSPGEFGLARLMRDIDKSASKRFVDKRTIWASLAASVVTAMAIFGWAQLAPTPEYELASGDSDAVGIDVTVRADVSMQDLSTTLIDLGLVVVDGPTALGLYRIGPDAGQSWPQVAEQLQDLPHIFDYVGEY